MLCRSKLEWDKPFGETVGRMLMAAGASSLVCGTLLFAPVDAAYAKTRISSEEQKVVDLFSRNTGAVVNITNLLTRCVIVTRR